MLYNAKPGANGWRNFSINARTALAFAIGCLAPIPFKVGGVLYGSELALLLVFLWAALTKSQLPNYWSPIALRLTVCLILALISYVATDLIRGTDTADYLRGWSKICIIITNFIAMYFLTRKNIISLVSYLAGSAVATVVFSLVMEVHFDTPEETYKFAFAGPITIGCLCVLTLNGKLARRMSPYVLGLLGILHIFLDYRSLALICFIIAAVLVAVKRKQAGFRINGRLVLLTISAASIPLAVLYISNQDHYRGRRNYSNSWRYGTTVATLKAIAGSPVIGSGSWYTDAQMEAWRDDAMGVSRLWRRGRQFSAHSQILEAWFEGGVLTQVFFFYYGFQLGAVLTLLLRRPVDRFSPLFFFVILFALWSYLLSPLNGPARLDLAGTLALLCYLRYEQRPLKPTRLGNYRPGRPLSTPAVMRRPQPTQAYI